MKSESEGDSAASRSRRPVKVRGNWEKVSEAAVEEDEEEKDLPMDSRSRAKLLPWLFIVRLATP